MYGKEVSSIKIEAPEGGRITALNSVDAEILRGLGTDVRMEQVEPAAFPLRALRTLATTETSISGT